MKKILTIAALLSTTFMSAVAQDDVQKAMAEAAAAMVAAPKTEAAVKEQTNWTNSVAIDVGFDQTGLFNWAKGGYNTLTLSTGIDAKANYAKDLMKWNNRLQLQYGFLWSADKNNLIQKKNDQIKFESTWSYKTSKTSKWDYTAALDFRSQFSDSYDKYKQEDPSNPSSKWVGTLKSGALSPGYLTVALGLEWKPNDWFDINLAPVTGGATICTIESLRQAYGMKKDESDRYKSLLWQFGAQVKANAKVVINDNFAFETQLVLFTDYLDKPFRHNRVNWDNTFSWQAAKYLKLKFNTWLIYDPIVLIDGKQQVQFKEYFSVNFTYSIKNK